MGRLPDRQRMILAYGLAALVFVGIWVVAALVALAMGGTSCDNVTWTCW